MSISPKCDTGCLKRGNEEISLMVLYLNRGREKDASLRLGTRRIATFESKKD